MSEGRVTIVIDNSLNPSELTIKEIWHDNDKDWENGKVLNHDIYDYWKGKKLPTSIPAREKASFVLTDDDPAGLVYETDNLFKSGKKIKMRFGFYQNWYDNFTGYGLKAEGSELTGLRSYHKYSGESPHNLKLYYQVFSQSSGWWEDPQWYPASRYGFAESEGLQQKSIPRNPSWMKYNFELIKNKTLPQICIPGAHDAATYVPFHRIGGIFSKNGISQCQSLNIKEQLDYGIRSFDFRVKYQKNNDDLDFYVYHGQSDSDAKIEPMLKDISDFLKKQPKEFVFVWFNSMANDGTTTSTVLNEWTDNINRKFDKILKKYFDSYFVNPTWECDKQKQKGVNLSEQPFEEYIKNNQRVLLSLYIEKSKYLGLKDMGIYRYAWSKNDIAAVAYPMSTSMVDLVDRELKATQFGKFRKPKIQFKLFLIKEMLLTPDGIGTGVKGYAVSNEDQKPNDPTSNSGKNNGNGSVFMAERLVRNEMWQSNIGIVHADFVQYGDFIQTCIRQNKIQIPEEKEDIINLTVNGQKGWKTRLTVNGCYFNDKQYLSFVGTDKKIRVLSSSDGVNYTNHQIIIGRAEWKTNRPVGIHVWKNKLYLSVFGYNSGKVWILSSEDGKNFTSHRVLKKEKWRTNHEIGISSTKDKLYLTTATDDGKIWLLSTKNGKDFEKNAVSDFQTFYPIGITTRKNKIYLTAIGKYSKRIFILSTTDEKNYSRRHLLKDREWKTYHKAGITASNSGIIITAVDKNGEVWLIKKNLEENTTLNTKLSPKFIETAHSVGIYKSKKTSGGITQLQILNGDGRIWLIESTDTVEWKKGLFL
ncbi:hypothetical protein [Tenacibaculum ascidiaceicola]|uniref:hypothetical protein n=1 Tax=Tenacibaculum ascidiaceicola TaxID=1699411 RepID=UPI003893A0F5